MKTLMWAALAAALSLHALPAVAATLVVDVTGIAPGGGRLMVSLCTRDRFLSGSGCGVDRQVEAEPGAATISIGQVPPGTYAIQVFHDANGNGTLDRQFLGIPVEGYGFSNNPSTTFGPPGFDQAAFVVDGDRRVRIDLFYRRF